MALSTIQWTDFSFNPWIGCRKVAPECANCYAETLDRNRYSKTLAPGTKENPVSHWGSGPRHRTKTWGDPLKWNRDAERYERMREANGQHHERPRVFCASLADWLDDENVPIEWFADLLKLIHDTPNLDWLLLTKRPQNWSARLAEAMKYLSETGGADDGSQELFLWCEGWLLNGFNGFAPVNVWIGVSAGADQRAALAIPAGIHFLSCEPMLRPLDTTVAEWFQWIIFGGESGSKARPCNTEWIREGVKFCLANKIAPFVKQMGSQCTDPTGEPLRLKDRHGGEMDEWPEDLRIREFPDAL